MMKKAAVAMLALGVCGAVQAADRHQGYVGLSYADLEQNDRFFGKDRFSTGEAIFRLGGHLNEIFDAELRAGATVSPKEKGDVEFKHDYLISGFLKAGYSFGAVRPYVAVGYTYGREKLDAGPAGREDKSFNDTSYAVGVDVSLGRQLGLNVELTQYYDIGNVTLKGPSAGVIWRF